MDPNTEFLQSAEIVDSGHPAVIALAAQHRGNGSDPRSQAIALYYAVRDGFRYDPYAIDLTVHGLKASTVLEAGHGWCVTKAALLAAVCRANGIPAKVGFADVRNHLSTERMRQTMQTDVFLWHGYTAILLDGQWLKATPAFNVELCNRFRLQPLEFDGREDSIYHPYDLAGNRHMEYLQLRGEYADVPRDQILADFDTYYPQLPRLDQASFDQDVARETA